MISTFEFDDPSPLSVQTNGDSSSSNDPQRTNLTTPLIGQDPNGPLSDFFDDIFQGENGSLQTLGTARPFDDTWQGASLNLNGPNQTFSPVQKNSPSECEQLQFLAVPNDRFRFRYQSEMDRMKDQHQRYLRVKAGAPKYKHPTIKIPPKWLNPNHTFYIRVNLVTIITKTNNFHYIHPYKIDSHEINVRKNQMDDTLYFPITQNDRLTGEKTFFISLIKSLQSDLKSCRRFRVYNSNEFDSLRTKNHQDSKEIISVYHLNKCHLIFTIVEFDETNQYSHEPKHIFYHTSNITPVLTDTHSDDQDSSSDEFKKIHCIPQQGNWSGGENCAIIMPYLIKKKRYSIDFVIEQSRIISIDNIIAIDTKTLLFQIPSCPILEGDQNRLVSIVLSENDVPIGTILFTYLTSVKSIINICTRCDARRYRQNEQHKRWKQDSSDCLISRIEHMSIDEKFKGKVSSSSDELDNSFTEYKLSVENYFHQLTDALNTFVRTNNPSQLFRRTRALITSELTNALLLHDAIATGRTETIVPLIEQIIDLSGASILFKETNSCGETPLLVAAKFNHGQIVECILKKRLDYVKQRDNNGNNLFHFLANLTDDQGFEMFEKILLILSNEFVIKLLNDKNNKYKTPLVIAQENGNTKIEDLCIRINYKENSK